MNAVLRLALFCLAVLGFVALASAQRQFTADFEMRHVLMKGGVVKGKISYSWDSRTYRLSYTGTQYNEIFAFNPARGYDPITVTDKPFLNQWVYKWGQTCACETGPVEAGMPQMFMGDATVTSAYSSTPSGSATINGRVCQRYDRLTSSPSDTKTIFWSGSEVCRVIFRDGREFTFSGLAVGAPASSEFTAPAGCKCGQPVDIAIVMDRSGSISQTEFVQQKNFVVGFANSFSYGPLGANLALVHFNKAVWTSLTMTEGVSDQNVKVALDALKCCTTSKDMSASCCCCGTSVSSGTRMGADQLALGRANVEKVLIVISDGYHNHDIYGNNCGKNAAVCRKDLADAVVYAKATVPDVKIFAVGVGADRDVSNDELMIVADQKAERVLRYTDFSDLAQNSLDLVARACQENLNPCGGCCGFCVCGQCLAPDQCDQTSFCNDNKLSGVCCKETPRDCVDPTDKCAIYSCDEANKVCVATPISCKTNTSCFEYACIPSTGVCQTSVLPGCGDITECVLDSECDDKNACTTEKCNALGQCEWTSNASKCIDNNQCTIDECDPQIGCKNTPVAADYCNDNSVCTTEYCDPTNGCVYQNVTCSDPNDNPCTEEFCDPFKGCLSAQKVCPNNGRDKCKLYFCLNGTCTTRKSDKCGPPVVAVAAALSTAAVIGIIIGIVLLVAGVGAGGAYAYSQAAGSGAVAPVSNNPIYAGTGNAGTNPLYAH